MSPLPNFIPNELVDNDIQPIAPAASIASEGGQSLAAPLGLIGNVERFGPMVGIPFAAIEWLSGGDNVNRARSIAQGLTYAGADELEAGARAIPEAAYEQIASLFSGGTPQGLGDITSRNLEDIRQSRAAYVAENPWENLILEGAGAVASPINKVLGPAKAASSALGRIGQAALVGAEAGGITGALGSEGDLKDRALGGLVGTGVGAAGGGIIGGLGELGSGLINWWRKTPEAIAKSKITESGAKAISDMPDVPTTVYDPLGQNQLRTVAEITQNPELAQLEQAVTKAGYGNSKLVQMGLDRESAQKKLLEGLVPERIKSDEGAGADIRTALNLFAEDESAVTKELYKSLPEDAKIPRKRINQWIGKAYKDLKTDEFRKAIEPLVNEIKDPAVPGGMIGGINGKAEWGWLHSLRKNAQQKWKDLKKTGNDEVARVANDLIKTIDDSIVSAGKTGDVDSGAVLRFQTAKKKFAEMKKTYGTGGIGEALEKGLEAGTYKLPVADVPYSVWDGTEASTRQLLKAAKGDKVTREITQGMVRDRILSEALGRTKGGAAIEGKITPSAFKSTLEKYENAILAEFEGQSLFDRKHINTLYALARDLDKVGSVGKIANRASAGQPTTAQALLQGTKILGGAKIGKLHAVADFIASAINKNRDEQVMQILSNALLNPKLAKALMAAPTPQNINNAAFQLLPFIRVGGLGVGEEAAAIAEGQ